MLTMLLLVVIMLRPMVTMLLCMLAVRDLDDDYHVHSDGTAVRSLPERSNASCELTTLPA